MSFLPLLRERGKDFEELEGNTTSPSFEGINLLFDKVAHSLVGPD